MNYLLATLGSWGDLHPFLSLARALRDAGHDVELVANAPYREAVETEGLRFHAACSERDHERTASHPDLWHPVRGFGVLWRHLAVPAIEPVRQRVLAWAKEGGDSRVVLASPLAVGARLACAQVSLPLCSVYTAPANLRPLDDPMHVGPWRVPGWWPQPARRALWWALDRWKLEPMARAMLQARCRELGLPPIRGSTFGRWVHSPAGGVALYPRAFGPAAAVSAEATIHFGDFLRHRASGDVVPARVSQFLSDGEAPVVLFAGSHPGPQGRRLLRLGWQASRALGLRALVLASGSTFQEAVAGAGAGDAGAQDGQDLLVVPHVPLADVLPRARAFVHHGGVGSCAEGLAAGVPQVLMPFAFDQFDNGTRVAALHAGRVVDSGAHAARELLACLTDLPAASAPFIEASPAEAAVRCLDALAAWERRQAAAGLHD